MGGGQGGWWLDRSPGLPGAKGLGLPGTALLRCPAPPPETALVASRGDLGRGLPWWPPASAGLGLGSLSEKDVGQELSDQLAVAHTGLPRSLTSFLRSFPRSTAK